MDQSRMTFYRNFEIITRVHRSRIGWGATTTFFLIGADIEQKVPRAVPGLFVSESQAHAAATLLTQTVIERLLIESPDLLFQNRLGENQRPTFSRIAAPRNGPRSIRIRKGNG